MNNHADAHAITIVAAAMILTACSGAPSQSGPSSSPPAATATATASPTTTAPASSPPSSTQKKSTPNSGGKNVEANAVDFGSGLADTFTFADVEVGASRSHGGSFYATQRIVITSVVFTSTAGDFALTSNTCSGAVLSPTSGCQWEVTYTRSSTEESRGADLSLTGVRDGVESSWAIVLLAGAVAESSDPSSTDPADPPVEETPVEETPTAP